MAQIVPYQPPPPPWWLSVGILFSAQAKRNGFGLSLLAGRGQLTVAGSGFDGGPGVQEKYFSGDNSAPDKVAILARGRRHPGGAASSNPQIDQATRTKTVKAIVLRVDPPAERSPAATRSSTTAGAARTAEDPQGRRQAREGADRGEHGRDRGQRRLLRLYGGRIDSRTRSMPSRPPGPARSA